MRCRSLAVRTAFALLLALLTSTPTASGDLPPAPGGPSQADLQRQARRCRQILKTSIIDFYLPACLDRVNGGYLESLKGGKFAPTGEKFLTLQARQHNRRPLRRLLAFLSQALARKRPAAAQPDLPS